MSSFNVDQELEKLEEVAIPPVAKERLRRQVDNFCLGRSLAFPPDPSMEWSPFWVAKVHKQDKKTSMTKCGAKRIESDGSHQDQRFYGNVPDPRACRIMLQRTGYGTVWPPLPSASTPEGDDSQTKFSEAGVVTDTTYTKLTYKIVQSIKDSHARLNSSVSSREAVILQQARKMSDEPRGRTSEHATPEKALKAVSDDSESRHDIADILSESWKEAVRSLNDGLELDGAGIGMGYEAMPLSHAPDLELFKKHLKQTGIYCHGKTVTPFVEFDPSTNTQGVHRDDEEEARRPYTEWTRRVRAAFLAPHLNLADLSRPENLLPMILHRVRMSPADFARLDYQACHIGRTSRIVRGLFSGFLAVRFSAELPSYIALEKVFANLELVRESDGSLVNARPGALGPSKDVSDSYSNGTLFGTGEAHVILLSQALTYRFLAEVCDRLLEKAMKEGGEDSPAACEGESAPQTTGVDNAQARREIEAYETEQRDNAVYSAEVYSRYAPRVDHEFHKFLSILEDAASASGIRMKEELANPNEFLGRFREELAHHWGHVQKGNGSGPLLKDITNLPAFKKTGRWDVYYDVVSSMFRGYMLDNLMWDDLAHLVKGALKEVSRSSDTNRPVDFTAQHDIPPVLKKQLELLTTATREYYAYLLSELVHRGKFVASEKLRGLFHCLTDTKYLVEERKDGRSHLRKTLMGFPRIHVDPRGLDDTAPEELREICTAMVTILGNPIAASVTSMKKLVDGIRLMNWDPDVNKYISAHVMSIIERLSMLVDFASHLDDLRLFRRSIEVNGLFDKDQPLEKPQPFYESRAGVRWSLDCLHNQLSSIVTMEHLDNFVFEEWDLDPAQRYRRIYQWLDQKSGCTIPGAADPGLGDEEAAQSIKKLAFDLFDCFEKRTMKSRTEPLSEMDKRELRESGRHFPRIPAPGTEVPLIQRRLLQKLRRTVGTADEEEHLKAIQSTLPRVPSPPAREKSKSETAAPQEVSITPNNTENDPAKPMTNGEEASDPAHIPTAADPKTSTRHPTTPEKKAYDRYNIVIRANAGVLRITGTGSTRTPASRRAERRAQHRSRSRSMKNKRHRAPSTEPAAASPKEEADGRRELHRHVWAKLESVYSHTSSVTWNDFQSGLVGLGYKCLQSSGGSAVRFVWTDQCAFKKDEDGSTKLGVLHYHRRHDNQDVPPKMMRDFVGQLQKAGLTWEFVNRFYKRKGA